MTENQQQKNLSYYCESFTNLNVRTKYQHFEFKPGVKKELITINESIAKLKQAVEYVLLDQELFQFLKDPESRKELIDTLINVWFSSAQKELQEILDINQ